MSRLSPDKTDTVELDVVYTADKIERELKQWAVNLANARAAGDILGVTTALDFIDCWLDRHNQLKAAA